MHILLCHTHACIPLFETFSGLLLTDVLDLWIGFFCLPGGVLIVMVCATMEAGVH